MAADRYSHVKSMLLLAKLACDDEQRAVNYFKMAAICKDPGAIIFMVPFFMTEGSICTSSP